MEDLYTSLLEMVHEGIRYTEVRLNYDDYYQSMSTLLLRAKLKAPEAVLQQLQTTCDALSAWSSQYRKGLPLQVGDSNFVMVSTQDFPHQERARQLRPLLNDEMHTLNAVMKKDLNTRPAVSSGTPNPPPLRGQHYTYPKEFIIWFRKQRDTKGQLVRLVKYLKSWCDWCAHKMPSGLCMTVLAERNFVANDREDCALRALLKAIRCDLQRE